jgi:hypothetical protein
MMTREALIQLLAQLKTAGSEEMRDERLRELDRAVPAALISNLVYYGERDRSDEEIADEALERQRIWHAEGWVAVQTRIERQGLEVLSNPAITGVCRGNAAILVGAAWREKLEKWQELQKRNV